MANVPALNYIAADIPFEVSMKSLFARGTVVLGVLIFDPAVFAKEPHHRNAEEEHP